MLDPKVDLRLHRRPVRVLLGFLTGFLSGPLIALLLVLAPAGRLFGPTPCYDCGGVALLIGLCCGPVVGLAVAWFALALQRWHWGRAGPRSSRWCAEPEQSSEQPISRGNGGEQVVPETGITRSTDSPPQGPASSSVKRDKPG
jgi:hypothetical protein